MIEVKELSAISTEALSVLQYLLAGFLVAWLVYYLTEYKKPAQFEQILQALLALLLVRVLVSLIELLVVWLGLHWFMWGLWTARTDFIVSVCVAIGLGLLFSTSANLPAWHRLLKKRGWHPRRSDQSVWVEAFEATPRSVKPSDKKKRNTPGRWVTVLLEDDRRITGWPKRYSPDSGEGHITLVRARWLGIPAKPADPGVGGDQGTLAIPEKNLEPLVQEILIASKDVKRIEFLEDTDESRMGS